MKSGVVYWITGLSGSGKSTLAERLFAYLQKSKRPVVLLDGDALREVFGNDLGYHVADRRRSAIRNSRLCKMLSDQGIDIVIPTISLFHEVQEWNRKNLPNYREIFVEVPWKVLLQRDSKQVYSRAKAGELKDVVGVDIVPEYPTHPHIRIPNDGGQSVEECFQTLLSYLFSSGLPKQIERDEVEVEVELEQ
jgi:cytidine diphosphoramidate kinase